MCAEHLINNKLNETMSKEIINELFGLAVALSRVFYNVILRLVRNLLELAAQ